MIMPGVELKVLVATKPVDFRKQADGLAALVQEALGADPFSGTVYVFRAKRVDRVQLGGWDGPGLCLLSKRLEGRPVSLAAHRERRDAAIGCAVVSACGGPRL